MNEILRRLLFLPPEASTVSAELDGLHYFVIIVTVLGAFGVIGVGTWFLIRYRRRQRAAERGMATTASANFGHLSLGFELTTVFSLLSLFVLWWFIGFRQFMRLRVAPPDAMQVYVTGKKWMWEFDYPQGPRSMDELYVPVGKPVKLLMTSRDVIHSFFVPDFRVKQDLVPGRYTETWFQATRPGRYQILCAEYCGTGHSTMRGVVVALPPDQFDAWLRGKLASEARLSYSEPAVGGDVGVPQGASLVKLGERKAADHGCLRCHSVDGSPHIGPTWKGLYGSMVPLADGQTVRADEAYLTESMMDPMAKIHRGFAPVMPSYQGQIDPADTAAIVEYMKSLASEPRP